MATKNLQKQVLLFSNPTNKMVSLLPSGTSPAILAPKIDSAMRKGRLKFFPNFYRMRGLMLSNEVENYVEWTLNDSFKGTVLIDSMRSCLAENKVFERI